MTTSQTPNVEALEAVVDRIGLKNTVELLVVICEEKAAHIAHSWQDVKTAKTWMADSAWLEKAAIPLIN